MWQALAGTAGRVIDDLYRSWLRSRVPPSLPQAGVNGKARAASPPEPRKYQPLQRVTLTDEVGRTLFEEFAEHRRGDRGEEETGWVLLGRRLEHEAVVLATLPAGAERNASASHVVFGSSGQALASRIVRQADRRLTILGVVHTHPGSLRHPSDGDFRGDSQWVAQLRGQEGVFGIGTADGHGEPGPVVGQQPRPHLQCMGDLCLSWYALRKGDGNYRPLPYGLTLGPDLARPLHPVWTLLEAYAEQIDRLYCQQAGVRVEVVAGGKGPAVAVSVRLAEPGTELRVLIEGEPGASAPGGPASAPEGKRVRYYLVRNGELSATDLPEPRIDRAVYLLLAELATRCSTSGC